MRIAVDARELSGHATGVGRYLRSLLERWAVMAAARRHEWLLFTHRPLTAVPDGMRVEVLAGTGGTQWEQWTLARALAARKPDLLFAPGYTAPLTAPCPVVLSVHDVSFAAHPEWFTWREGVRRRLLTAWASRRARLVLTISQFSRDEILKHIGVPATKVRVIPLGMDRPAESLEPGARGVNAGARTPGAEPLVLYVGSIFRRRHVDRLIDAFVAGVAPRVPRSRLEIVGDNRLHPAGNPAAALPDSPPDIARRVTLRSYVDEATLTDLYRRAAVFVFLSEYEGFGLTPLEALASGVPPLVLDTRVAREIYGDAARYVPSPARDVVSDAIVDLLTNASARDAVRQHAGGVLARYDWDRTAAATLQVLEEAAGA